MHKGQSLPLNHSALLSYLVVAVFAGLFSLPTIAQERDKWWFEIELIVFKRDLDPSSIIEGFPEGVYQPTTNGTFDLIRQQIEPDLSLFKAALPLCDEDNDPFPEELESSIIYDPNRAVPIADSIIPSDNYEHEQANSVDQAAHTYSDQPVVERNDNQPDDLSSLFPTSMQRESDQHESVQQADVVDEQESTDTHIVLLEVPRPIMNWCRPTEPLLTLEPGPVQHSPLNIDRVPSQVTGVEWPYQYSPYLLERASLQLTKLAKDLDRQKGLSQLLHIGWRQKVLFGQTKAATLHLFAGQNFATQFDLNGKLLPEESPGDLLTADTEQTEQSQNDLFTQIEMALSSEQPLDRLIEPTDAHESAKVSDELWELDGRFKVFLRYIKGTPYLHIESDLDYRTPVFSPQMLAAIEQSAAADNSNDILLQPDILKSFPFSQLRRVISTQIHYFDHPLFGMVVQIRRHTKPQPPSDDELDS